MSSSLLIIISLIYAACSLEQFNKGDLGHAWMFIGYVVANIGLLVAVKGSV